MLCKDNGKYSLTLFRVHKARDTRSAQTVAIKVLDLDVLESYDMEDQVKREVRGLFQPFLYY